MRACQLTPKLCFVSLPKTVVHLGSCIILGELPDSDAAGSDAD